MGLYIQLLKRLYSEKGGARTECDWVSREAIGSDTWRSLYAAVANE